MKITINRKIEKKFANARELKINYGKLANRIEMVLSVLKVANNLKEVPNVPPTRRHKLVGDYEGCWALDIDKNRRMILRPTNNNNILEEINELEIIAVVDYH